MGRPVAGESTLISLTLYWARQQGSIPLTRLVGTKQNGSGGFLDIPNDHARANKLILTFDQ